MKHNKIPLKGHELYYFSTCPYCIFVRLSLWWIGLNVPLKDILFSSKNKADLVAGGGKGQVPCLRIENNNGDIVWMYESVDIVRYLKSKLIKT
ncbi:glutathione S-transferase N-terminal domain-containing protein [Teredinibacter franksiae]|uniref:glutathione S-transferase N-terminal domain-containing protein n=1 Tax=Teredinibacter franksiae TaxID=2761453 RepID=UPI001626199D|nr:glutathione S-transferase N-terminal domain-containing protein [Teredinibacter franksiae]